MSLPENVNLDIRLTICTNRSPEELTKSLDEKLFRLFGDGEDRILTDGEHTVQLIANTTEPEERSGFLVENKPIESLSRKELIDSLKKIGTALDNELGRAKKRVRDLGGGLSKEE